MKRLASARGLVTFGLLLSLLSGCSGGGGEGGGGGTPAAAVVVEPIVQSIPPSAAQVGKQLQYQLDVASSAPATLIFGLTAPMAGMFINAKTGLLTWIPTSPQSGDQSVTVSVTDSQGQTSQSFTVTVFDTQPVASVLISKVAGGVVTVNNANSKINGLSLNIPAGALPSDLTITISELTLPASGGGSGQGFIKGFTIDPDGTQLSTPATLTIPYSVAQWPPNSGIPIESSLGVFFLDPQTGSSIWLQNFTVDTTNHVVTGTLPHFSAYGLQAPMRLCPPQGNTALPDDCPATAQSIPPGNPALPVILVHGFQLGGGFGTEATWGSLRSLLSQPTPPLTPNSISAWRFDWNSQGVPFENSAGMLAAAITQVISATGAKRVNLLAHSFGGILVRTYLQGQAVTVAGKITPVLYHGDVGRVMTLGTPHSGIGDGLSLFAATECAKNSEGTKNSNDNRFVTCFEMNVGAGGPAGDFLRGLNQQSLQMLGSADNPHAPQYYIIKGSEFGHNGVGGGVHLDDGLITLAGQSFCSVNGGCSTPPNPNVKVEALSGLCHSNTVWNCPQAGVNFPEAQIDNRNHPLWQRIYNFLTCSECFTLTINKTGTGTGSVTSSPTGVNCGVTCSVSFTSGTFVILTATAAADSTFNGWSGDCQDSEDINAPTTVFMDRDLSCIARFDLMPNPTPNPANVSIDSITCTTVTHSPPFIYQVQARGTVSAPVGSGVLFGVPDGAPPFGGPTVDPTIVSAVNFDPGTWTALNPLPTAYIDHGVLAPEQCCQVTVAASSRSATAPQTTAWALDFSSSCNNCFLSGWYVTIYQPLVPGQTQALNTSVIAGGAGGAIPCSFP